MAKVVYVCGQCGRKYRRPQFGACECGAFQQFKEKEEVTEGGPKGVGAGLKSIGAVAPATRALSVREVTSTPLVRTPTGIGELDRVLGGGFVDGEVLLLAGAPGSGKSTLCMSIASRYAQAGRKVLYLSGEESEQQIGLRARRMGVDSDLIRVASENRLETVLGHMVEEEPSLVIVDSLQTVASSEVSGSVGSVSQSKEAAHALTRAAKASGIVTVLISQVVKSGDFGGSEAIQHIVDATMMLESDSDSPLKFLRAIKNRFGDTAEVGVFQHCEKGLEEVSDPSGVLVESSGEALPGAALSFMSEGVRQIPVEVQALVSDSSLPTPRKQFSGVSHSRGQIVCAILDKFCDTGLFSSDVFVSTVSGVRVDDPLTDLAVAAAVVSSVRGRTSGVRTAYVGELSLTGQVRGSFMMDARVKEAARLGFERVVVPAQAVSGISSRHDVEVVSVSSAKDLLDLA